MHTQGAGSDQAAISPGEGLFQHGAIAGTAELGSTAPGGSQATIKADRQHQPQLGQREGGGGVAQAQARASSASGRISSCGTSA